MLKFIYSASNNNPNASVADVCSAAGVQGVVSVSNVSLCHETYELERDDF